MNNDQALDAVVQLLNCMIDRYREIESSVERILALDPAHPETQRELRRVDSQRLAIQSHQKDYRRLYAFCSDRQISSPKTKQLSQELRSLVEQLISKFADLEERTKVCKQKLLPAVNENVRVARMKSAYNRRVD